MATVRLNERATIERRVAEQDPLYGTPTQTWTAVASRIWVEVQDVLPSRAESTENGARLGVKRARLRLRMQIPITADSRVVLHTRGDRVMQVISGPALLDDKLHVECMIEEVGNG